MCIVCYKPTFHIIQSISISRHACAPPHTRRRWSAADTEKVDMAQMQLLHSRIMAVHAECAETLSIEFKLHFAPRLCTYNAVQAGKKTLLAQRIFRAGKRGEYIVYCAHIDTLLNVFIFVESCPLLFDDEIGKCCVCSG